LFDADGAKEYERREKAILSEKFSLGKESSDYATRFALALKKDPYLCEFETYNPNYWVQTKLR